jgi:Flp pilus assembly protein TadG
MRKRIDRRWRDDQGATLVEFSLITFMYLILLFSVVEMGRMLIVYTALANAAHAGTRYAIVHGSDLTSGACGPGNTAAVQTAVSNFAAAGLLNTSSLNTVVSYPAGTNTPGSTVTVTVTYTYDPLLGYFSKILNKTLGSSSEGVITF